MHNRAFDGHKERGGAGLAGADEIDTLRLYWRAANFVSLCLMTVNTLDFLRTGLKPEQTKETSGASWGCVPAINLVYAHVGRLARRGVEMTVVNGAGHGIEAVIANSYLDESLERFYPEIKRGGLEELLNTYDKNPASLSHAAIPGTAMAGMELGHSLSHAYGMVLDRAGLIACCIIGDGEAETAPLSAAWLSHLYLDPSRDGSVLPVINLNGLKQAARSQLAVLEENQLIALMNGRGYRPLIVEGTDPVEVHRLFAGALESAVAAIRNNRKKLENNPQFAPSWPCIVLKTPKGWTSPKIVDQVFFEGTARTSRLACNYDKERNLKLLERWLHSYTPAKLFDKDWNLRPELKVVTAPPAEHSKEEPLIGTNAGALPRKLKLPETPQSFAQEDTTAGHLSRFLQDVFALNQDNFRLMSSSGANTGNFFKLLLSAVSRAFPQEDQTSTASGGRVMEILSQHTAQGWLEGYLQSGNHGIFLCSEQYCSIVDSMLARFSKWLADCARVSWREPIPALTYLITSTNWTADERDRFMPAGFYNILLDDCRANIFVPADAHCALACLQKSLESRQCINAVIVEPETKYDWLDAGAARNHVEAGIGVWPFAGTGDSESPDLVMVCAGATASGETVAAADIIKSLLPDLSIRVINVCNPKTLLPGQFSEQSLSDSAFAQLFPAQSPLVVALPWPAGQMTCLLTMRFAAHKFKLHTWQDDKNSCGDGPDRFQLAKNALSLIDCPEDKRASAAASLLSLVEEFQLQ